MAVACIYAAPTLGEVDFVALRRHLVTKIRKCGVRNQDAGDLAQEVLIAMMERLGDFRAAEGTLEAWANGFVRLIVANYRKRCGIHHARYSALALADNVAQEENSDLELQHAISAAIDGLAAEDAEIVRMRFAENLSSDEIAVRLDIQASTARKRLSRAVERLRQNPDLREALGL